MAFNLEDYSLDEIEDNLWCVVDTVTGLTHMGILVNEGDRTSITLYYPSGVFESETGQVVLTQPMHIGSSYGVVKLNCNTTNVQFTPCEELVDAYIETLFNNVVSDDVYTVDTVQ